MTMKVGGLAEVMSSVMGFGRHAEVLEPAHLWQVLAEQMPEGQCFLPDRLISRSGKRKLLRALRVSAVNHLMLTVMILPLKMGF